MNKSEFLIKLADKISMLSEKEKAKTISYYREILDDRIENGMSEQEAVSRLEDVDIIAKRILSESNVSKENVNFDKIFKFIDKILKSYGNLLLLLLLIFGIPLWFPILAGAFSVISTIFLTLIGSVVVGAISSIMAIIFSGIMMFSSPLIGMFLLGISLIGVGITTLLTILTVKLILTFINICKKTIFNVKIWLVKRRVKNEKVD